MSNQQVIFSLIAQLAGSRNKIVVDTTLCDFMGGLEEGVFLSQLLYWSDKGTGEWFHKSDAEWCAETCISRWQVRAIVKKCKSMGFLDTKVMQVGGTPKTHYRVDSAKFIEAITSFMKFDCLNSDNPIVRNETMDCVDSDNGLSVSKQSYYIDTEITTETTTENKTSPLPTPTRYARGGKKGDAETPAGSPATVAIMRAYEDALGYQPSNYAAEAAAAKKLATKEYTPADVVAAYTALKQQNFWADKHLSLQIVLREIPALAHYAKKGGNINSLGKARSLDDTLSAAFRKFDDKEIHQ